MELQELEALVGRRFPGGTYHIEPYEHWLRADAMLSPELPAGVAHPMYVYFAALGAMGMSLDELFAMVEATADSGVMFGEAGIEQRRPLAVGASYPVDGEIVDVRRKSGKRAGTFDIVGFRLTLRADDGDVVAVSTNSFVFPRRS